MKIFKWIVGLGGVFLGLYVLDPSTGDTHYETANAFEGFGRTIIAIIIIIATLFIVKAMDSESKEK